VAVVVAMAVVVVGVVVVVVAEASATFFVLGDGLEDFERGERVLLVGVGACALWWTGAIRW
jgi:hypothetical protein